MPCVKLKKVMSRKDKEINRKYWRYDITIPNETIKELDWEIKGEKSGKIEMKFKIQGKKLIIEKGKS